MRQRGRASCYALLLLALLVLWRYQEDLLSLGSYCFASREQDETDRNTIAACQPGRERISYRQSSASPQSNHNCMSATRRIGRVASQLHVHVAGPDGRAAPTLTRASGDDSSSPSVLIVGASRGIGLGLAKSYAASGWKVHATTRTLDSPGDLGSIPGDVTL